MSNNFYTWFENYFAEQDKLYEEAKEMLNGKTQSK
jgi:hypothetical protein